MQILNATNTKPVCPIVRVSWVNITRIEVQVIGVSPINTTRPVVAISNPQLVSTPEALLRLPDTGGK